MTATGPAQPAWVCYPCGARYGTRIPADATWHIGPCDVCGRDHLAVTEPRDFGYLRMEWRRDIRTSAAACGHSLRYPHAWVPCALLAGHDGPHYPSPSDAEQENP